MRYDRIEFDRTLVGASTSTFGREYDAVSWRVGSVYDLQPKTQLFAQYSSAVAPVGNFVLLSLANSRFDLTTGESVEAGIKSSFWNDHVDRTVSAYRIKQDDIITRDPSNPTLSVQGGSQSVRGIELSASGALNDQLTIDANYTALDARFDELREAGGVSRAGNTPPRVPETIGNLFVTYRLATAPLALTAGARHAGSFHTDTVNTVRVKGYTVYDASIRWTMPFGQLALHGRNLTDELYVDYSDVSSRQFQITAPRSIDLTLTVGF
ncbi:MAG: TonB-dependent receptor [Pseudomonadota bacterium]|nr:TonB-dependent receptor [Pseudomonadota bacterium]